MKAFLMHRDRDFDVERALPPNEEVITQDLELTTLWNAMAGDDPLLLDMARRAMLLSLRDPEAIAYRQQVLVDCLAQPSVIRGLYELAGEAIQAQKAVWGSILQQDQPRSLLHTSVQKMEILIGFLRKLREVAAEQREHFSSEGLTRFFSMLMDELDDDYFALIDGYVKELSFKGGVLQSTRLAAGNKSAGYTLRRPREQGFIARLLDRSGFSFTIADRDEAGSRALGELQDRGANVVANALAQSVHHVLSFFIMLRTELAFYVACLNLADRLAPEREPVAFPEVTASDQLQLSARGLYDVALALTLDTSVTANDLDADEKSLVMITGANQGGKSTLLRSIGLAQLMAQAGMFVAADSCTVSACRGVFTHYKREEDETMESGKLDEELGRMRDIADLIEPECLLLCNESFAATNEREGSQIARQVLDAMLAEHIRVVFVTHMFDLSNGYHLQQRPDALFLRAERGADGARPFRVSEGEPLPTSYGEDSYRKIFGHPVTATGETVTES